MRVRTGGRAARAVVALLVVLAVAAPLAPAAAAPQHIDTGGTNGVGRASEPGLPCEQGGDGASWHYGYESLLAAGTFTSLPTGLRLNLDVHGETIDPASPPSGPNGFLQGSESTVSLVNERGTVVLRLADGGSCGQPTATLADGAVRTTGSWTVVSGSGAFTTAAGSGGFTVNAGLEPGADNAWDLALDGNVTVAAPELEIAQVATYWGALGLDYLLRRPTVVLRVTNTGTGDAFGALLTAAGSGDPGVTPLSSFPVELGDLLPGESVDVALRYQLGLLAPCSAVILNCRFAVGATTTMNDALDVPRAETDVVPVYTPLLAPLL